MTLLDGNVVGGFPGACLQAAIGSRSKQEFDECNISIIRSQMQWSPAIVRSLAHQSGIFLKQQLGIRCESCRARFEDIRPYSSIENRLH